MVSITKSSTGCGAPREPCCERKYAAVFVRQLCARFPLFVTPFPQQKITRATSIPLGREYYCFQRKRDLPEGESGLTDVFENRQRDSVQATGNGRKSESSYSECDRRRVRQKHGLLLVGAERFRDNKSCDLEPEPDLRKSEQRGRDLAREIAPSFLCAPHALGPHRLPSLFAGWGPVLSAAVLLCRSPKSYLRVFWRRGVLLLNAASLFRDRKSDEVAE
jgi:hypothetical protein